MNHDAKTQPAPPEPSSEPLMPAKQVETWEHWLIGLLVRERMLQGPSLAKLVSARREGRPAIETVLALGEITRQELIWAIESAGRRMERCGSCKRDLIVEEGVPPLCLICTATDETEPETPAAQELGGYRLEELIGEGGMGKVYRAFDPRLQRHLAIKVLDLAGGTAERFEREGRLVARLNHPYVLRVHGYGIEDGVAYLAMDYVDGLDLDELLNQHPLSTRQSVELLAKVARGIAHAHRHGIIHRDLKPSNILVDEEMEPRVVDFGIALSLHDERLTLTEVVMGTPFYMAPEQVLGEPIDSRTDIYALGVMLYKMLAGQIPYRATSRAQLYSEIAQMVPKSIRERRPGIPIALDAICLKALEKQPDQRYQTADLLADDLERYLAGEPVSVASHLALRRAWRLVRRSWRWLLPVTLLVASLILLGILHLVLQTQHAAQLKQALAESQRQRDDARVAREQAQRQRDDARLAREQAQRHLEAFGRLADIKLLSQLKQESEQFWLSEPTEASLRRLIVKMDSWLTRTRSLLARLPQHRAALKALGKSRATGDHRAQWRHDVLTELVARLSAMSGSKTGLVFQVQARRTLYVTLRARTAGHPYWRKAIAAIGRPERPYKGLRIRPQLGLLPLGPDPKSGLWEFAHVLSGETPVRDAKGRLKLTEQTSIVLVLLPATKIWIGASRKSRRNRDPNASSDENPVHRVTLRPFFISKYELTQGQWKRLTGENPSYWATPKRLRKQPLDLRNPVESISWLDCQHELSRIGLRLPTESQWEYAARAGTRTIWWTGNDVPSLEGAANLVDKSLRSGIKRNQPGAKYDDGHSIHAAVGSFLPNPFGLHDVVGNLWEWCSDQYIFKSYRRKLIRDGRGARKTPPQTEKLTYRVYRGGSWGSSAMAGRSANRNKGAEGSSTASLGVRPARTLYLGPKSSD